jgi:hypothetical protein
MAIPEAQLQTWTNEGAALAAEKTYTSVKAAFAEYEWREEYKPKFYLQGSYRNTTNIYGDSDVDVVVQIPNVFRSDVSALTEAERVARRAAYQESPYQWSHAHTDTLTALKNYYDASDVKAGRIAIKVKTPHLSADVVVYLAHRRYKRFIALGNEDFEPGSTIFVPSEDRWIVNYPKKHYENGVAKHSAARTNGWFKPSVRMFKNAFASMVDKGMLNANAAFSYAIECFVYSAPDDNFGTSYRETYCNVVNWAAAENLPTIRRVSEAGALIGPGPEQWTQENAEAFLQGLVDLWNNWE